MVDSGKRARFHRDADNDGKNYKRRATDRDDKGNDDLIVYRILCPDTVIGSVIGKSGKVINSIRQDTRAKVKVVDPFPGAKFRVITIYCYVREKVDIDVDFEDEFDETKLLCAAQDALLRVHAAIASSLASASDSENKRRDKEECHILVPSSQSATIIGKGGSSIKKLRGKTRANIRVTSKDAADPTHSCAMDFDNFLAINGDPVSVKKALYAVSSIMYKFTPKEEIPLDTTVAEAHPSIIIPSDIPIYQPGGLYPSANDSMLSSRSVPPLLGTIPDLQGYADAGNPWPIYSSSLPVVSGLGGASRSEELAIRVLCPFDKIGRVIGKGGSTIKSIRQATGARIEVNDTKDDRDECIITVTATESPDDLKSMAVEALLMLQGKINDEEDTDVSMRLLIPSRVIGCIIGKAGSIVNEIRKRTGADIRISKGKKPRCAEPNDELVEVTGEVGSVRDALIQIALRLRDDVLREMEDEHKKPAGGGDSQYSGGAGLPFSSMWPSVPPVAPMGYDHRAESGSGLGMVSSSGIYGYGSLPMGENGFRDLPSYTSTMYGGLVASSTIEIMVPSHAVGKVMGKGGANIANIRKISGAMVEVSEPKSSRGDRIAHISGTPEQKRTAENLIQAFIMAT